jgi:hypothetical protein
MACGKKDQLCGSGCAWGSWHISIDGDMSQRALQQWWQDGNIMVAACNRRWPTTLGTKVGFEKGWW